MSVLELITAARDLGRLREIAATLIRFGLGDVVQRLGLLQPLERAGRALDLGSPEHLREMPTPERLRRALEELGPTFVKFGQLLATRPDLLAAEWIEELSRLHQSVTPVGWDEIRPILVEELGEGFEGLFGELDESPLAAGSLGQVHAAALPTGERVVVKIRRPGVRATVEADLRLLERLAELTEQELPELRRYRPVLLVRSFARTLRDELDFGHEARATEQLAAGLEGDPHVSLPRVHKDFTRERLLVLERIEGLSAREWESGERPDGLDGPLLARRGAEAMLRAIFADGLYHADPHPGNVFFLPGSRIALIDCGMVGHLTERRREEFLGLIVAVLQRDERQVAESLLAWAADDSEVDEELLAQDVRAFVDRYHGAALGEIALGAVLHEVAEVVRANGLFLPPDVTALIRVFALLDALGTELDPDFDLTALARPIAESAIRRYRSPWRVLRREADEALRLARDLPRDLRQILDRLRRGKLGIEMHLAELDRFADRIDASANRLTVGLITAALIVGTAITMTVEAGPRVGGFPVLGLFGFLSSGVVGTWVLWSILRSGRR
ncbi:MAG: ABC1 kinase family protein [Planctomycetota bacterium]